jgi:hypothetical protein
MDSFVQIRRLFDFDVNYPRGKVFSGASCSGRLPVENNIRSRFHVHLTFLALSSNDLAIPSVSSFERMIRARLAVCSLVHTEAGKQPAQPAAKS